MPHRFKKLLEKITREKAPGPSTTFSIFHMLRAIELIAERTIGRSKIAEELEIGEGAVRTMINRLKDAELISTSKLGCTLTNKGLNLWNEHKTVFRRKAEIEKNQLTLAEHNLAILVKNSGHKVKSGMKQRDTAIMTGATGATTIICKGGHLMIPSVSNNMAEDFSKAANQIIKLLKPEENDAIVIGSASSLLKAEYGALAAAWTLLNDCD
jgi:Mn-dependent DtxR family transcriptional regulator